MDDGVTKSRQLAGYSLFEHIGSREHLLEFEPRFK